MHRIKMFQHFGVTPYVVFDGGHLPSKASTELARAKRREESRKAAMELLKAGKKSQAYLELQKAVDVTPEMAHAVIQELKRLRIPYVVAPYEADAQMVYLERHGLVSGIVSEDSDLLVFGAKRLLTKLDKYGGCVEINRRDFCACREISLTGWSDDEFRQMAILSGCDYLEGINNVGLKTAYRMLRKYKTPERVVRMLRFDGKTRNLDENYLPAFRQAELTFLHQRVFCPTKQDVVLLTEPGTDLDVEEMPFIGAKISTELARAIAVGDVNPITKKPIQQVASPGQTPVTRAAANQQLVPPAGKPIDSYFKGSGRVPMGAMDPNCFAVDPEQVAALTQNGLAPRVFPLPRPYLDDTSRASLSSSRPGVLRRRTEPIASILGFEVSGNASSRRRTAGPSTSPGGTVDASQMPPPAKKARLCNDANGSPEKALERSRFFTAGAASTPAKKADTLIMSDDSIEEALADLPDVDSWNSARSTRSSQSLSIFQDDSQLTMPDDTQLTIPDESPSQGLSKTPEDDDIEVPRSPPLATEPSPESLTDAKRTKSVLGRFSYSPGSSQGASRARGLPSPVTSSRRSPAEEPQAKPSSLTPLQRIGRQALNRGTTAALAGGKVGASRQKSKKPAVPLFPANPCFVPLPKVDMEEVEALNQPLGSEDLLIPDSDGEAEGAELLSDAPVTKLDLSRYLCAAKE
jgi:exonuclease 1